MTFLARAPYINSETAEAARGVFEQWSIVGVILLVAGLLLPIFGAWREWPWPRVWLSNVTGMVAAALIWEYIAVGAVERIQPGIFTVLYPKHQMNPMGTIMAMLFVSPLWTAATVLYIRTIKNVLAMRKMARGLRSANSSGDSASTLT